MSNSRAILRGDNAENKVLTFDAPKIELGTPQVARDVLERQRRHDSDFRMSDVIRKQTGVEEIEAREFEDKIEQKVLARIQEIQESAYAKAYELGLEEGRNKAFAEGAQELQQKMQDFDHLITSFTNVKMDLVEQNEAQLVQLLFAIASKLAFKHISEQPEIIADVIRKVVESTQADEEVTVSVHPEQKLFLEQLQKEYKKEYDFLKKVKLNEEANITIGGCLVETNYGQIDAQVEERVKKLWDQLSESLTRIKSKVSAA